MQNTTADIEQKFFSRDISWLSFNERVLDEAARNNVPLAERLKFLSIFSSNLDEFYRVRMPVIFAKQQVDKKDAADSEFREARLIIQKQQEQFGKLLREKLIPALADKNIKWLYNQPAPDALSNIVRDYFYSEVAAFLQVTYLKSKSNFFPENNKLYLLVSFDKDDKIAVVNIPSDCIQRFFTTKIDDVQYILFIDDIIKMHFKNVFEGKAIKECYSFKITRDAELELEDEVPENIAEKIEKQLARRDLGQASRMLYQQGMPLRQLLLLCSLFSVATGNAMEGSVYHNLKDIINLPLTDKELFYEEQKPLHNSNVYNNDSLFNNIIKKDIIIHSPYESYDSILRFFSEAAIDNDVEEIYVTLYRIAQNSRIANALISAAKNGKKVNVFVELKARFDEANNIKWAKKMKDAGVKIIYSIPGLKVHAKIALVKKIQDKQPVYIGLLGTGNLNETTAKLYTDHILLTAHKEMLQEMALLFAFLNKQKKPDQQDMLQFNHLLVAQFNLQQKFLSLIEREIENARQGFEAGIIIKINNLEERILILKLYEASNAGVKIKLIVRSICCLIPGVKNMSENITIERVVGRYLEHGRIFTFHNNGATEMYIGSADWMNRNIYTRIEVCFPIYNEQIKKELQAILQLQLNDNMQAVYINKELQNVPTVRKGNDSLVDAQNDIYNLVKNKLK